MRRYLFLTLFITIIFFIIFYIISDKLNINNIISDIENKVGINIKYDEKGKWSYYPKLKYKNNLSFKSLNDNLIIEKSSIDISRQYKIISPFTIIFKSPSILYKGINLRNSILNAEYNEKYLHIKKFYADVIDGNIYLLGKFYSGENKKISIKGSYNNISINRILKQLNISNWERVKIKLSSSNFELNTTNGPLEDIIKNLNGKIDINGSMFFVSTETERFGASFLELLSDEFISLSSISKSLNYILDKFADTPTDILGDIIIENGFLITKNLLISNQKEKALLSANLDLKTNFINGKIDLYKGNKIFLNFEIQGNIENPEILIINSLSSPEISQSLNIKRIFEKGIESVFDSIINRND